LVRPRMFLIENVPDLIRHRQGRTFAGLLKQLESPDEHLRYRIEFKVYDAAWFGTPQARRRIIILGVRHGAGNERLPDAGPDLRQLFATIRHGGGVSNEFATHEGALKDPRTDNL